MITIRDWNVFPENIRLKDKDLDHISAVYGFSGTGLYWENISIIRLQ